MEKVKRFFTIVGILIILGIVFYKGCSPDNYFGYLGFDKIGRQIYIQSLNEHFEGRILVESEFFDRNVFMRFLKEPQRTTLRFNNVFQDIDNLEIDDPIREQYIEYVIQETQRALNEPIDNILDFFDDDAEIYLTEDKTISGTELRQRTREAECMTVQDFYKGLGFNKYEVYINGEEYYTVDFKH